MAIQKCPAEWSEWVAWLAAGLHGRCRWRLSILLFGVLFARGRRTVASWLRAAGVGSDFQSLLLFYFRPRTQDQYYRHAAVVCCLLVKLPRSARLLLAIDDTPTKRYGPKVQGAGIHHNPTPGPADAKFLYGHIWVTLAWVVRHPLWGTIGLPLLGQIVRASEGHCQNSQKTPLEVSNQTRTSRGLGGLGRGDRVFLGKTTVDRGRRFLRQTAISQAGFEIGRDDRKSPAQGRLLV